MGDRLGWDWFPESGHVDAADARLRRGADQLATGKASLAEATFRAVIEAFPESAIAHALLAMSLADQDRGREALHAADEAIRLNSHLALAHAARACALEALQAAVGGRDGGPAGCGPGTNGPKPPLGSGRNRRPGGTVR